MQSGSAASIQSLNREKEKIYCQLEKMVQRNKKGRLLKERAQRSKYCI